MIKSYFADGRSNEFFTFVRVAPFSYSGLNAKPAGSDAVGGLSIYLNMYQPGFAWIIFNLPAFAKAPAQWNISTTSNAGNSPWQTLAVANVTSDIYFKSGVLSIHQDPVNVTFIGDPMSKDTLFPVGVAFLKGLLQCFTNGVVANVPLVRLSATTEVDVGLLKYYNLDVEHVFDVGRIIVENGKF